MGGTEKLAGRHPSYGLHFGVKTWIINIGSWEGVANVASLDSLLFPKIHARPMKKKDIRLKLAFLSSFY